MMEEGEGWVEAFKTYAKFHERWNEEAFRVFMKKFGKFKEELENHGRYSIEDLIKFACSARGLPAELSHRTVGDFVWFFRKAYEEIEDSWLWSFWEWFYYFYRFYAVKYSKEVMERV